MRKVLPGLVVLLFFGNAYGQNQAAIKGFTVTGIEGVRKSLAPIIAYDKLHPLPPDFKAKLRPEMEGPRPGSQDPAARKTNKFGTLVETGGTAALAGMTQQSTQAVNSNFLTIWGSYANVSGRESPYTPPDNCGDVGTTQIIATANCRMKVFNKPAAGSALTTPTGTGLTLLPTVLNVNLNTFFANPSLGISGISDPHVRFDRLSGRWFVVAIDVNHTVNNYCCIAVSDGPTIGPNSGFTIYYFNVSQTGGNSSDFFDYPTLGIDKFALYIGGNMFRRQRSFSGSSMWVVDKASLLAGSVTVTGFPNSNTGTDMYTPQGVHNDDPAATNGFFIGSSQSVYGKLVIRRVSFSGSTPSLSGDLNISTAATYAPKTVPTLGGTSIDGNDHRLCAAMIKKNKITGTSSMWVAQGTRVTTSGVGSSSGDRDGALWAEIGNLGGTPAILQGAILYDGVHATSSAEYYTYPTIAMSGQGHNLMGFTSAGPAKYAQASAAGRYRTDAAGSFQAPADFTTTTSTYNPGASRWGDYTQTVVDPSDDQTMWTFTEYVPTTNAWGVRAAQFKAPPPATPVLAGPPACGTTTSVTINGTSTNNSEFFDPGPDTGGPGFEHHLGVAVSGPSTIAVSNIVFVNPTQVTADFTVPANAASGTYTVIVTNPDGQAASTTFTLSCGGVSCGDPTGLAATNISTSGATLGWDAVGGASSYSVQYKESSSGLWSSPQSASSNTYSLSGLNASTSYDWQVRANCSGVSGNYVASQFTTTAAAPCDAPTGLGAGAITSSSATVSWSAVSGANSYDVDYKLSTAGSWTNAATGTTLTSVNLAGLAASSIYDYRVRTNCASGSSGYSTEQFTTAAAPCNTATGLSASAITSSAATISWSAVSGAISYDVDYTLSTDVSWNNATTVNTTSTSVNISGLAASTTYNYRVKTNCSSNQSGYTSSQFTTLDISSCDTWEPNNSSSSAAAIPTNTDVSGQINPVSDIDYYTFSTNGSAKNFMATLTNLPANYDMEIFDSKGNSVGSSTNTGTASESISYNNKKPDTYTLRVYGATGTESSASQCYTLYVQTGSGTFVALSAKSEVAIGTGGLRMYPVPANSELTIVFDAATAGRADLSIVNQLGQPVFNKTLEVTKGTNTQTINVSSIITGVYTLRVNVDNGIKTGKIIITK